VRGRAAGWIALAVLAGVVGFWGAILVAAALEPGYANRRDYVSTLAAHGAAHAGLAIAGIVAVASALIAASVLVRGVSRLAAIALAVAGAGFLVAAFTRLECPNGAAGCGLGGRFELAGSTEIGHWTATTVSSILVIAGMVLTGVASIRLGRRVAGVATLATAVVTGGAFLATGGDQPGTMQRVGIAAATAWLAAVAVLTLVRARGRSAPMRTYVRADGTDDLARRPRRVLRLR
jgi:hypothetical protein